MDLWTRKTAAAKCFLPMKNKTWAPTCAIAGGPSAERGLVLFSDPCIVSSSVHKSTHYRPVRRTAPYETHLLSTRLAFLRLTRSSNDTDYWSDIGGLATRQKGWVFLSLMWHSAQRLLTKSTTTGGRDRVSLVYNQIIYWDWERCYVSLNCMSHLLKSRYEATESFLQFYKKKMQIKF